jgi:hypothetical protein
MEVKNMIDIKNGTVDFGFIHVNKITQKKDFDALPVDLVEKSTSRRGSSFYILKTPIDANGISMRASIYYHYGNLPPIIELRPYGAKNCKEAFNASHKWLEFVLGNSIKVVDYMLIIESEKMKVSSVVKYTLRDGLESGGSIEITFH